MDQLKKFKKDMENELKDIKDIKAGVEVALPMLMQGFQTGNLKQVLVGRVIILPNISSCWFHCIFVLIFRSVFLLFSYSIRHFK